MITSFHRTVRTALRALLRNILRSGLTTLGIVIGVAAVIGTMELGQGSSRAAQETIARMGANNLMIQPGTAASGGVSFGSGTQQTLTVQDAEILSQDGKSYLHSVAPVVRTRTQIVFGNRNWVPTYLYGTTPDFLEVREWDLEEGYCFTDQDVRNANQVCLVGMTVVRELFNGESPLDSEIRINNQPFKVIGVLVAKGANMVGIDQDDVILAPWTAIKFKVAGNSVANVNQSAAVKDDTSQQINTLSQRYPNQSPNLYPAQSLNQLVNTPLIDRRTNCDVIWARGLTGELMPEAKMQIGEILRRNHRLRAGVADDFNIRDMTEQNAALGATSKVMGNLLLGVAFISLVVGGVGIMNIMLVSVTERTREIGLRMAVGARRGDILRQFLTEAIILCMLGGALGIAVGRLGSLVMRWFLHWPTESSLPAIIASVTVSVLVGVIFGYYPAWKASRLDPIQALRYE